MLLCESGNAGAPFKTESALTCKLLPMGFPGRSGERLGQGIDQTVPAGGAGIKGVRERSLWGVGGEDGSKHHSLP